jgi:hypothetical protein
MLWELIILGFLPLLVFRKLKILSHKIRAIQCAIHLLIIISFNQHF